MQQVAARGHLLVRVHTERALLEAQTLNLHVSPDFLWLCGQYAVRK